MNLMDLFVKIGVDDKATKEIPGITKKFNSLASSMGKGFATAAKIGSAAIGVVATGILALTKASINQYAEYEQLAGGAQKIFDQMNYSKIAEDAGNAYKELGLSANQYLAVMNDVGATFAATMGDEAGYEAAKTGLKAISDYASGTGKNVDELSQKFTLITRSTSSYQSIADQFSGILPATSAGFLEQAQAAGILSESYTELTQVPIDEYQAAVSQMLQKGVADLGLANNAMNEAFSTLSGSLSMAKGAWSNLVTGLTDDSADLDMLIGNFVESVGAVATQLIPKISVALNGAAKLIGDIIPVIVNEIPALIEENLPVLAGAAVNILQSLMNGISENQEMLFTTIFDVITFLSESFIKMLPQIVQLGLDIIVSLANGIAENIDTLVPTIVDVVLQIVDTLTDPNTLSSLIDACIAIVIGLANGLIEALPKLLEKAPEIIGNLVEALVENAPKLLGAAWELIKALVSGIIGNLGNIRESGNKIMSVLGQGIKDFYNAMTAKGREIVEEILSGISQWLKKVVNKGKEIIDSVKNGVKEKVDEAKTWGKDLIQNFIDGITAKWRALKEKVASVAQTVKNFLGFSEPKEGPLSNFHTYAPDMMELFAKGIRDNESVVTDQIAKSFNFGKQTISYSTDYLGSNAHNGGFYGAGGNGNTFGDIIININGAKYSDEDSLAEALAVKLQDLTGRRELVWA